MFSKSSLIVFLAVTAIAVAAHTSFGSAHNIGGARDFLDDANNKLKEFLRIIKNDVRTGKEKIGSLKDEIILKKGGTEEDAQDKIQEEFAKLTDQLNEMKIDAHEIGKIIDTCLEEREVNLNALPLKYLLSTEDCFYTQADQGLDLVQDSIDDINGVLDQANDLKEEFNACESVKHCIEKMLVKIATAESRLPAEVTTHVTKALSSVKNLLDDVYNTCIEDGLEGVSQDGGAIIDDIAICISELPP